MICFLKGWKVAKHYIDWLNHQNDNFVTRIVIEDLINTGIAKVPGARPNKRTKETTIQKRIDEEVHIANLWESVDKHHSLSSLVANFNGSSPTLSKMKEALTILNDFLRISAGETAGEFSKQLSLISGIWIEPSKLAECYHLSCSPIRFQEADWCWFCRTKDNAKS